MFLNVKAGGTRIDH